MMDRVNVQAWCGQTGVMRRNQQHLAAADRFDDLDFVSVVK